jgi:hypothetical protein
MKKALAATMAEFESSSAKTPEYLVWHRLFKREFTKFLGERGATNIKIGKPNHFDMSGFFTMGLQVWYFSIGDLRGFKDSMLIRTAKDYHDFRGGMNQYIPLTSVETFAKYFQSIVGEWHKTSVGPIIKSPFSDSPEYHASFA